MEASVTHCWKVTLPRINTSPPWHKEGGEAHWSLRMKTKLLPQKSQVKGKPRHHLIADTYWSQLIASHDSASYITQGREVL